MSTNFTISISDHIWSLGPYENDIDSSTILSFINDKDNFRPFSEGLTLLLKKYGYTASEDDSKEKTSFLLEHLRQIGVSTITKKTITNWFRGTNRPALVSNSRTMMYQICFALSVSLEDLLWFFHHVYFDRAFNCHVIDEAVYYFCFKNGYSYEKAQEYIHTIQEFQDVGKDSKIYTNEIQNFLDSCSTEQDFLDYFQQNKASFSHWNCTAMKKIQDYLSILQGRASDKKVVSEYLAGYMPSRSEIEACGLVIQEYILLPTPMLGTIQHKTITSIDFMLEKILGNASGLTKAMPLPALVKNNFPSKKNLSNILKETTESTSTSYSSIRKTLILLEFYQFFTRCALNGDAVEDLFDCFVEECNTILYECGYEDLFAGNPYDLMFLYFATCEDPVNDFRGFIEEVDLKVEE